MAESVEIEKEIDETRNSYRSVAIRGSILYFVIADLNGIDPMYQYSLAYIKILFNAAIEKSEKREVLEERLDLLIDNITKLIFTNVSRGIFEAHKNIFSFLIAISINRHLGKIDQLIWSTFLRGAGPFNRARQPKNPMTKYISQNAWDLAYYMQEVLGDSFPSIADEIEKNGKKWVAYAESDKPEEEPLPGDWENILSPLEKLLILKIWRPEKILMAVSLYVKHAMGQFFIEFPSVTMEEFYKDTDRKTPVVFVLSTGADPTQFLMKFVHEKKMQDRMSIISLGQGQGKKAQVLIHRAR